MYLYLTKSTASLPRWLLLRKKREKRRKKITIISFPSFVAPQFLSSIIPSGAFLFIVIPTDTDKPVRSTFVVQRTTPLPRRPPAGAVLQQPTALRNEHTIYGGSVRGVREIVRNIPLSPDEELVCDRIAGMTRRGGGRVSTARNSMFMEGKGIRASNGISNGSHSIRRTIGPNAWRS